MTARSEFEGHTPTILRPDVLPMLAENQRLRAQVAAAKAGLDNICMMAPRGVQYADVAEATLKAMREARGPTEPSAPALLAERDALRDALAGLRQSIEDGRQWREPAACVVPWLEAADAALAKVAK